VDYQNGVFSTPQMVSTIAVGAKIMKIFYFPLLATAALKFGISQHHLKPTHYGL
jgi:hypothetical protein